LDSCSTNAGFGLKQTQKKRKKKEKKKKRKAPWVPPIFEFPLNFDNFKQIISRKFSISKKII